MQKELWIKGNYAYLVVIEVEPNVIEDKAQYERVVFKFSNVFCHKLFLPKGDLDKYKEAIEKYLVENNIEKEKQIVWQGDSQSLVIKLIQDEYQKDFDMQVKSALTNGVLQAVTVCNLQDVHYAFYVNCNGKILYRGEYEEENFIEYKIKSDDIECKDTLQVVHFLNVRCGRLSMVKDLDLAYEEDITKYYQRSKKKKLFIHGSCVSRDILNFGDVDQFKLVGYAARQSIFSVQSKPLEMPEFENKLVSKFQKRMLVEDFEKPLFEKMSKVNDAYLIIDLIDTIRFPLYKYEGSIVTGSTEFNSSGVLECYDFERISINHIKDQWDDMLQVYVDKVREHFDEHKVIIHCAYFKYFYRTNNFIVKPFNLEEISKYKLMNSNLKELYEKLREKLPNALYIDECKSLFETADERHHFGLSPVHYTEKYYLKVKKEIEDIK